MESGVTECSYSAIESGIVDQPIVTDYNGSCTDEYNQL